MANITDEEAVNEEHIQAQSLQLLGILTASVAVFLAVLNIFLSITASLSSTLILIAVTDLCACQPCYTVQLIGRITEMIER